MAPMIWLDDDVHTWLQQQAQTLGGDLNSVLRRIAASSDRNVQARSPAPNVGAPVPTRRVIVRRGLTGRQLNEEWGVGALHALFHRDGTWFNNLEQFPGALFDPEGYVLFWTEEEYRNSPYVKVGQETNVPRGISSMPGYVRKR